MKVSEKLRNNLSGVKIKNQLGVLLGVDRDTIYRWLQKDNEKFAHLKVIKAVTKITGLTQEEMFEEEIEETK